MGGGLPVIALSMREADCNIDAAFYFHVEQIGEDICSYCLIKQVWDFKELLEYKRDITAVNLGENIFEE